MQSGVGRGTSWVLAAAAGLLAAGMGTSAASAAIVPTIDFDTQSDYDNNFAETTNPANISYNSAGQYVLYNPFGENGTSVIRYDTVAGAGMGPADFLTETLRVDTTYSSFGPSSTSSPSAAIMTRIQTGGAAAGKGVMGIFNPISTTSARLRLFWNADSLNTAGAGTVFYDGTFNLTAGTVSQGTYTGGTGSTNAMTLGSTIALTLTQTSAADPVFNFSISDLQGPIASTGNQTLASSATNAFDGAGMVALRANLPATGSTITFDNFSATAVPEPATATLLVAAGAMFLRRRRR